MSEKRVLSALLAGLMILTLCACGKGSGEAAVTPEPLLAAPNAYAPGAEPTPVREASGEMAAATPDAEPAPETVTPEPTPVPTAEITPEPTPAATIVPPPVFEEAAPVVTAEPAATPAPTEAAVAKADLRPGVYVGSNGSTLTVEEDGSCTYETEVSGKLNGKAMTAVLVFHGAYENGGFSFDKVTYGALDLTTLAAAAGYTDASPWEAAAAALYGAG